MKNQSIDILKEFENLKGQFVINSFWNIERLIAIASDKSGHKFYVTYDGKKVTWQSEISDIIPLKNRLLVKEYKKLKNIAELNHYDQPRLNSGRKLLNKSEVTDYITKHREDVLFIYNENYEYITDICWEIN